MTAATRDCLTGEHPDLFYVDELRLRGRAGRVPVWSIPAPRPLGLGLGRTPHGERS